MTTLRAIHERCKARHAEHMTVNEQGGPYELCEACDTEWPCADYLDAVAALAILDAAERAACPCPMCPDPTHGGTKGKA